MTISARSEPAIDAVRPAAGLRAGWPACIAFALLAGCGADPAPPRAAAPSNDPQQLAADLNARLDALQRQPQPASDDVIASLERTLREQREKRARAIVAAGNTGVVPGTAPAGVARPTG